MFEFHWGNFLNALIYSVLGIVIFIGTFVITDLISPYKLWAEIVEGKNTALAIFCGLMALGVGIIIASAVH